MLRYYELLTDTPLSDVKAMHPKEAKKKLASLLVGKFYNTKTAEAAEAEFEAVFKEGKTPQQIDLKYLPAGVMAAVDLLTAAELASSKSEARRIIGQRGVKVDGETITDENAKISLERERLLQKGKRIFLRVVKK
jgi:tyrosyl-tRNA synthetase